MGSNYLEMIIEAAKESGMSPTLKLQLDKLAKRVGEIDEQIEALEEQTKNLSKERNAIAIKTLPPILLQCGLNNYTTDDGLKVELDTKINGSLPKDPFARKLALALIIKYGAEGVIRNELSLQFTVGEGDMAAAAFALLDDAGYKPTLEQTVHAATLAALARERLQKGEEVDGEKLGLFIQQIAKVKQGKAPIKLNVKKEATP